MRTAVQREQYQISFLTPLRQSTCPFQLLTYLYFKLTIISFKSILVSRNRNALQKLHQKRRSK